MPLNLKLATVLEANKLRSPNAWPVLLEFSIDPENTPDQVVRVCDNNEDIIFQGNTFIAFSFQIDSIEYKSQGELPSITLRVSNIQRAVQSVVDKYDGGTDSKCRLIALNMADLTGEPEVDVEFQVQDVQADEQWVSFQLGAPNPQRLPFPRSSYMNDHCDKDFNSPTMQAILDPRGVACAYEGPIQTCSHKLEGGNGCRAHNNILNFGGYPGVATTGFRRAQP